ncbi:MAG: class I SAM-dependent methyltransferase [Ruminococcus sp.]
MENFGQVWQNVQQQKGIKGWIKRKLFGWLLQDLSQVQQSQTQQLGEIQQKADSVCQEHAQLRQDFEQACVNLRNNNAQLSTLQSNLDCLKVQLRQLERHMPKAAETVPVESSGAVQHPSSAPAQTYDTIEYFDFENHFRGSVEQIKNAQRQYLPYFTGKQHVLDLGCGRGEFLSLMQEQGIPAVGVDLYEPYVEYCTMQGLNAVCGDGVTYLSKMDKADGIFVGQVVEHLTPEQIMTLCRTAFEKLEDGGCLVVETPNPTSLSIYTNAFYIDPSHVKPVHPLTMQYYLEKAGFTRTEIIYTESSRPAQTIPELHCPGENVAEFNAAMQQAAKMLYGSQDYAIVAVK